MKMYIKTIGGMWPRVGNDWEEFEPVGIDI